MSYATANQALGALFGVLESGQVIEFVYRGGMDAGRTIFSFQIRGKTRGITSADAEAALSVLKQNLEMALAARPGLCFGDGDAQTAAAAPLALNWRGELVPQGVLVSCGEPLQSVSPVGSPPEAVYISPHIPLVASSISVVDAVLTSPRLVEVVVSVRRRSLSESDQQTLKKILRLIDFGKATYQMLPERRKAVDAEREEIIEPVAQHLRRWLVNSWGIELGCVVHASESPTDVFMSLLGRALYPSQKVAFKSTSHDTAFTTERDHGDAVDLRGCINASCRVPPLFPQVEQLADIGNIKRQYAQPQQAPSEHGLCLGVAGGREACLAQTDRSRHVYIIGATGCGKSTLLYNMIMQDIVAGAGVCVMDPHGDLYHDVLESIPSSRREDVVLIDPCDFEYTVGINFLEVAGTHRQVEMSFISNEMIKIFDRLYDMRVAGGPVFEQYMRNTLLLVMGNDFPGTLMDVSRVFEDDDYRKYLKSKCKNPLVTSFWDKQAERAGGDAELRNMGPYITSKLNQFTHNPLLRPIIGQRRSSINFRRIMDGKHIVLVNLSKGLLGEMDSQLLGMILIGKLFLAAMGRANVDKTQRAPFNWYIDEFQNFATDSIAHLLSESRKYGIRMTLANQNMAQLRPNNGEFDIREAVLGNVANLLLFRMGVNDARQMETYTYPELASQDLQYLPDFHAVARLLKNNAPLRPFVLQTLPKQECLLNGLAASEVKAEILALSRSKFARPTKEVEFEIFARAEMPGYLAHNEDELKKLFKETNNESTENLLDEDTSTDSPRADEKKQEVLQEALSPQEPTEKAETISGISMINDKSKQGL